MLGLCLNIFLLNICVKKYIDLPCCHLPLAYEGSLPRRKSSRNWGLRHTTQFTPHYTVPCHPVYTTQHRTTLHSVTPSSPIQSTPHYTVPHEATPWTVRLFCEYVPMSHTPHHPLYATLPMYYTVPHHNHLAAWHTTHTTSERHTTQLYLSIFSAFC